MRYRLSSVRDGNDCQGLTHTGSMSPITFEACLALQAIGACPHTLRASDCH